MDKWIKMKTKKVDLSSGLKKENGRVRKDNEKKYNK